MKINALNLKLQNLQKQTMNLHQIEEMSLTQFLRFKLLISKRNKIDSKIQKKNDLANQINKWYNSYNDSLLKNPKVSCRKYCKLQQNAEYKRDLKLYKLGFLSEKPQTQIHKHIKNYCSKFTLFQNIKKRVSYFKSCLLPQKINLLAVNAAVLGIKGYRKFEYDYKLFKNTISSKESFKYLKNVINEANTQLNNVNSHMQSGNRPLSTAEISFRDSLKLDEKYSHMYNINSKKYSTKEQALTREQ